MTSSWDVTWTIFQSSCVVPTLPLRRTRPGARSRGSVEGGQGQGVVNRLLRGRLGEWGGFDVN